eukprot:1892334-Amphidinium_carterae.1
MPNQQKTIVAWMFPLRMLQCILLRGSVAAVAPPPANGSGGGSPLGYPTRDTQSSNKRIRAA